MKNSDYGYVLCSNPRSGTTLLCDMLEQTGVAGRPNSFFREKSLLDWCKHWKIAGPVDPKNAGFTQRYFDAMIKEGRALTPVFGLRLMGPDLNFAGSWLARRHPDQTTDCVRFEAAFGPLRYIHLSRRDKLAEAVSYMRAEQSGLWHQNADGSDKERIDPDGSDGFDGAALRARMIELRGLDDAWEHWFSQQDITPLRITYETLAESPQDVLAQVLDHIGQDSTIATSITPGLRKLADGTSADWMRRYRQIYPDD